MRSSGHGQLSEVRAQFKAEPSAVFIVQGTRFGFVGVRFLILAQTAVSKTTGVVGYAIVGVKLDGLVEVLDGSLVLVQYGVSNAPIAVGKDTVGV